MASQNYARRRQTRLIILAIVTLTLGISAGFILFPNRRIEKKLLIPPVEALNKLTITTCYSKATVEEIEVQVTKPMEQILRGVEGLRNIKSVNTQGKCTMELEFALDMNMDVVADEIRRLLRRSSKMLPADLDGPPTVEIHKPHSSSHGGSRNELSHAFEPGAAFTVKSERG